MTRTGQASGERTPAGHGAADGRTSPSRTSDWQPLAGRALLDRLRVTGRPRPVADPALVADLRSHLERGLDELLGPAPGHGALSRTGPAEGTVDPLVITAPRLARALACPVHAEDRPVDGRGYTLPLACGALVGVLFRQLVTTGSIGDAFADGLAGLAVDDHRASLAGWIAGLAPSERSELRTEVVRQADDLRRRWPALDPAWLPRTRECIRVPLSDGRAELVARVDLAVGRPGGDEATVALLDVSAGSRRPGHRHRRQLHALVETLRSTAPPFAVATYYTRTGELDVDPVTEELLADAARRCRAGLPVLSEASRPVGEAGDRRWCAGCAGAASLEADPPGVPVLVTVPSSAPERREGPAPAVAAGGEPDGTGGVVPFPEDRAA